MNRYFRRMPLHRRAVFRTAHLLGELGLGGSLKSVLTAALRADLERAKQRAFRGYTPTTADVFVCTWPKSGTNWMMQLAQQTLWRGAAEFEHIHDVVPWPDSPMPTLTSSLSDPPGSPTRQRVIKTHCEQAQVPYAPDARYIMVIRDPKDAFVSSYHFVCGVVGAIMKMEIDPAEWLELFFTEDFVMGSWAEHTASWWALQDRENVAVFTFRQMKRDLPGVVDAVSDLVGVPLSAAEHAAVVERSAFAWMRAHEHLFEPTTPGLRDQKAVMIRSGRAGSTELISDADRARIDAHCRSALERLGSDFPYAEHFPLAGS